ncbi:hypothetical protein CWO90_44395 [Bradyrhizobium sp. Leo121]|nr:hypothetical protein CWO90_44395 [Bradyrhizobium sp. Leo121]
MEKLCRRANSWSTLKKTNQAERTGESYTSLTSLLDPQGNELGRNITSHRRLWNKRSATFDERTFQLPETKHTLGKLYKRETK